MNILIEGSGGLAQMGQKVLLKRTEANGTFEAKRRLQQNHTDVYFRFGTLLLKGLSLRRRQS